MSPARATALVITVAFTWTAGRDARAQADAPTAKPAMVVFPTKGKGGPNLKAAAKRMVEAPLKKSGKVEIIPLPKFQKAARKAKIKPKDLASPMSAQAAGEAAGATHVLIVEGLMEQQEVPGKKRKKKVFFANVSLIDVRSGDVVFSNRWDLQGRKLTKVAGAQVADAVLGALEGPAPEPTEPAPEPEPVAEPPPPPPEPPPPVPADEPALAALTADIAATETDPAAAPTETVEGQVEEPQAAAEIPPEPVEPPPPLFPAAGSTSAAILIPEPMTAEVSSSIELEPERSGRWRPGINVVAGVFGMTRTARISVARDTRVQQPPCYCVPEGGGMNPIFPAAYVAAEIYPLAIGGTGALWEGIGLHLEGFGTLVTTQYNAQGDLTESTVYGGRGGLSYRFVWWDSELAPDFRLDLGVSYFGFPLAEGVFPGVQYFGQLYVGGNFEVPLFTRYLSLLAGGTYTVLMEPRGKTKQLGDAVKRQTTFLAQGGLKGQWNMLELRLLFRYEKFETRFEGETSLPVPAVFRSAKLTDEIVGGVAAVGVHF